MNQLRTKILPPLVAAALLHFPISAAADPACALGNARQRSAISELCPFKDGMARLQIDDRWGFVAADGRLTIAPQFDEAGDFSDGVAAVRVDEKWGLIDKQGQWIVKPSFNGQPEFRHGLAAAAQDGKVGYIDRRGTWVIAPQFWAGGDFGPQVAVVEDAADKRLLIDRTGRTVKRLAPEVHPDTGGSRTGLISAWVSTPALLVHLDGRRLPFPDGAGEFKGGLFIASAKVKRGGDETDAYGLMDARGKWIVPARFRSLRDFDGKLAIASPLPADRHVPEQYGLIGRDGEFVVQPAYDWLVRRDYGYQGVKERDGSLHDVLDANGKLMFSADCADLRDSDAIGSLVVVSGCDNTWVVHRQRGLLKHLEGEWNAAAESGHLLLTHTSQDGDGEAGKGFHLYDGNGKRVAGTDPSHQFLRQHFDHVGLVRSADPALPLAIFGNYRSGSATGFLTRDYQLVTREDWEYDSPLLDYSFQSDKAAGPLVMKAKGTDVFGAVDMRGNWVVPPTFSKLTEFEHGMAFGQADGETVLVDAAGKIYQLPENVHGLRRTAAWTLSGQAEEGEVRFDPRSGQLTPARDEGSDLEPERVGSATAGLKPAQKDGKWGLLNEAGAWVLAPTLAYEPKPLMHGERLAGWEYGEGDGKPIGLVDPQGRELVKPRFTNLSVDPQTGLLIAQEDGYLNSVLHADGKTALAPIDGRYTGLGDGWFKVEMERLHGLLDARGEWVVKPGRVEFELDNGYFADRRPYAIVGEGAGRQLVDFAGRVSTQAAPRELGVEEPSQWWWSEGSGDDERSTAFYGYNFKQRVLVPGKADERGFSEGVIEFKPADPAHEGKVGLMDDQGKLVGMYEFESIAPMQGGMAKVYADVPLKGKVGKRAAPGEESVTRYGFLNRAGKLAIPPTFEDAGDFSEKRATVVIASGLALIDDSGKILLQGSWQCGRTAVLMDSRKQVLWPLEARGVTSCAR